MKAVILAAGLGTRLQPYTFLIPKPMLPLGNKPTLEHIIDWLKESKKIDQIIICVSYLHRLIENYFEEGKRFCFHHPMYPTAKCVVELVGSLCFIS